METAALQRVLEHVFLLPLLPLFLFHMFFVCYFPLCWTVLSICFHIFLCHTFTTDSTRDLSFSMSPTRVDLRPKPAQPVPYLSKWDKLPNPSRQLLPCLNAIRHTVYIHAKIRGTIPIMKEISVELALVGRGVSLSGRACFSSYEVWRRWHLFSKDGIVVLVHLVHFLGKLGGFLESISRVASIQKKNSNAHHAKDS